jgi:hypothetical protein
MSEPITMQYEFHFQQKEKRKKELQVGKQLEVPKGRIPRISRLMALAIKFDGLIRSGAIENHAELARLGKVTRARVSQILNLLHLAPDIQEAILFLPRIEEGRAPITLSQLQPLCQIFDWKKQRQCWIQMESRSYTVGALGKILLAVSP